MWRGENETYGVMNLHLILQWYLGFPSGSVGKESACNVGNTGELGLILGCKDPLEEEMGNPLQYSCLGNLMDRGSWHATVQRVAELNTIE